MLILRIMYIMLNRMLRRDAHEPYTPQRLLSLSQLLNGCSSGISQFPKNADAIAKLQAVTASSCPFVSVWYCQRDLPGWHVARILSSFWACYVETTPRRLLNSPEYSRSELGIRTSNQKSGLSANS